MTERQRKGLTAAGIVIFILFMALIAWYIGRPLLRFVEEPEQFRHWVDSHGIWGRLAFVGMVVLQVIVAIIPGEALEVGAGYAFGVLEGTCLCLAGTFIGGVAVFCFVRRFGLRAVEVFFSREKIESLRFLQNEKRVKLVVFLLFLLPGTPKDVLSYMVGLTRLPLSTWMLITSLARLPSVLTSTVAGAALGDGEPVSAVVALGVAILLSAAGFAAYRLIRRWREKGRGEEPK